MKHIFKPYTAAPAKSDRNAIMKEDGWGGYASNHIMGNKATKGYILPNCVGLVHAQDLKALTAAVGLEKAMEYESKLSTGNAENYWKHKDGRQRGQTPKIGAIIVWEGAGTLAGHVATVKHIADNGDITVVASDYGSKTTPGRCFYEATYKKSKNYEWKSTYKFLGFIYPPVEYAEKYVTEPVERNTKVDQLKVTAPSLSLRTDPTTSAHLQGYVTNGYYDVLDTYDDGTYIWVKISNEDNGYWCAHKEGSATWGTEMLPREIIKYNVTAFEVPDTLIEEVETFLDNHQIEFCSEQI